MHKTWLSIQIGHIKCSETGKETTKASEIAKWARSFVRSFSLLPLPCFIAAYLESYPLYTPFQCLQSKQSPLMTTIQL